jgi:hypothetical protein
MSSRSRRSSYSRSSVISIRPPAWQAVSKKSAPASVSLISAEPQLPQAQSLSTRSTTASTSKLKKIHKKASLLASNRDAYEGTRGTDDTLSIQQEPEPIVSGKEEELDTLDNSDANALDAPAIVAQPMPNASQASTIPEQLPSSDLISDAIDSSVLQTQAQSADHSMRPISEGDVTPRVPDASAPSPEHPTTPSSHEPGDTSSPTSVQTSAVSEGARSENNTDEQTTETVSWFPSFSFAFAKGNGKPADLPIPPSATVEPESSTLKEGNMLPSDDPFQVAVASTSSVSNSMDGSVPMPSTVEESQDANQHKSSTSSQASPRRGWFGSSSPTNPSPLKRQVTLNVQSEVSSISIDEEVPGLATSPSLTTLLSAPEPSLVPSDSSESSMGQARTLSTLNPSQSRFTLSIPLLGKSKVPLNQVVSEANKTVQEASGIGYSLLRLLIEKANVL